MKRKITFIVMLIISLLMLTSCIPGDGTNTPANPAGFFWGIWHGWAAPVSLIIGLFRPQIRIYEIHNIGWWYDFGFYMAVISGFGSISLLRKKD